MTQWSFHPILDSYLAVLAMAAGMLLLLLVGPAFRQLSRRKRRILTALRLGVILLVLIAMLRPTVINTVQQPQSAVLLLLLDQSRSMQLPSASGDKSRWQVQRKLLEEVEDQLAELGRDLEVKLYAYDSELHRIELDDGKKIALPEEPLGDQTDIGTNLYRAVHTELGKRLAGVVLLGDGAQTAFSPQIDVQQAAREVGRLNYPLYTITFGPVGDAVQSRDVAVENLPERYTVFVKNEVAIRGAVRLQGYVNQKIPAELLVEDPSGQQKTLGPVELLAREDGQLLPVELPFVPEQPGQHKLTLRVPQQPGEMVTQNNELTAFLNALEGGLRVLYLYGDLLGEQLRLRRSIDASPDIQLDDIFLDPRNRDRWPVQLGDALTDEDLDVVLIENVDSEALGQENLEAIAERVEQGTGLMMIGGFNSFGPGGYQETPLARALPIEMGRFERQEVGYDQTISRDLHLWDELTMLPVRGHSITRLAAGEENLQVWETLPPLKGANKFVDVKPYAEVLAATPEEDPLLVAGPYGEGRVLAFAGNTTARWWQYGRQKEHRRFWRQVVLWLAHREDLAKNDVWIDLDQRRYNPGARITFSTGARAATGDVIQDADFKAELVSADGSTEPVRLAASGAEFTGVIRDRLKPGDYRLQVEATKEGEPLGTAEASFQILDRDVELTHAAADYDRMQRLAQQTKEAGGRALAPEQLSALLRELQSRRHERDIDIHSKWQLGDTPIDAWLFFLGVVGLIAAEWALRKKWGLV